MRKYIFVGLVLIAAGVTAFMLLYQPKRIDSFDYSSGAHRNWPIFQLKTYVNGKSMYVFKGTVRGGWERPSGGGSGGPFNLGISKSDPDKLFVSAKWVEMLPNYGWRGELTLPIDMLPKYETLHNQYTIRVITRFGPNGLLQLVTSQGEVLAETCGTRAPELDKDYRDQIPIDPRFKTTYSIVEAPPPATNCPDPEE